MIKESILGAAALMLMVLPGAANAQAVDASTLIDGSFISSYDASFSFFVYGDDGVQQPGGTWSDTVRVDGDALTRRVDRYNGAGVVDLSRIIIADHHTLLPTVLDQRFGPGLSGVMHADYNGGTVNQVLIPAPAGAMRAIRAQLEEPVWELALWATIAMSLPFEEGQVFSLPVVGPDRQSVAMATFEIEGEEAIEYGGEAITTTRIRTPEQDWVFWVRKEPPYILQIDHPAGDDGSRATSTLQEFSLAGE